MLHIGEVFPGRNDSYVSTDDYLVKPELGKKWNEFVKRQKVELNCGGALKETTNKFPTTQHGLRKMSFWEKNIGFEAIYTRLVGSS